MSIHPLPIFERDADPAHRDALTDAEAYARLKPPTSIVVRVGRLKFVAEYPYSGREKPGCGSKLVVRTHRGTEVAEMLTTTCSNSGCSKSISRQEMLQFIEASGGRDYPFHADGAVLRVATADDLARWQGIRERFQGEARAMRLRLSESGIGTRVVDVEPVLGGESVTVHVLAEDESPVPEADIVGIASARYGCRVEVRTGGARDEARLTADYDKCGQHCCCTNFLKVLKPVSMKSAKVQKATLDPLKISGRCGRLMCCLRYEDETYATLSARLPKVKARVRTPDGEGTVIEARILVQLVLVRLDATGESFAYPVESVERITA
jgi:cell fate regulator YaaT (PSP1 superfamily)